ncbi:hypothetical protein ACFLQI_02650 [Candidatus Undinarchaeota archaeon]
MSVLDRPLILMGGIVLAASLLTGMLVIQFSSELKFGGAILVMVVLGVLSRIPQRFAGGDIGIELITLFTVCTAVAAGMFYAIFVGVLGMGLSWFFTKERPDDVLIGVIGFGIVAFVAAILGPMEILVLGMMMTLLYDAMICAVYVFTGHTPVGCVKFILTHIIWNFVMFRSFAPYVLAALA